MNLRFEEATLPSAYDCASRQSIFDLELKLLRRRLNTLEPRIHILCSEQILWQAEPDNSVVNRLSRDLYQPIEGTV